MDKIMATKLNINNNAALAIQAGNYSDAKQLLSSALFALRETLQIQQNESVAASSFNGYCSFLPVTSREEQDTDSMTAAEDTCFLFNSPVQIKTSREEEEGGGIASTMTSNTVTVNEMTLTQVIVYNLALCIHLQGTETSEPVLMKRAVSLYGKVASVLLSSIVTGSTTSDTSSTSQFLKIAVVNNMGHCYSSLRLTTQAQRCFQELANSILVYNTTNYDEQQQRQQLAVGFISNAMLGCWRATSKSAPAA